VIGTADQLSEICRRHDVDMVVVAMADRRGNMPMAELLDLKFAGVEVLDGVHLYEQFTEKLYIRELKPSAMVFSEGFRQSDMRKASKRVLDVVVASIGLVIAAIPMLVTALLVKLTSPGPSIYAQERVGEFGRVFTIYKFRSMRLDSERDGPKLASRDDPRVTAFGRFIRKTRLDELPQLFNVLRGDMSLVGPRPERPVFHIKLQREVPFFRQRLFVKPGVTGLAQVKFRYAETAEDMVEKLQYDLAYIKHMSLLYDLQIILETAKVMLFRRGAQ
jgi:sugar transferase (PEP-CTERM system associated)